MSDSAYSSSMGTTAWAFRRCWPRQHTQGPVYHHFTDKQDFALQVIDQYMLGVHAGLDQCLGDATVPRAQGAKLLRSDRTEATADRGAI